MYKYIVLPILVLLVVLMAVNGVGLLASCVPIVKTAPTTTSVAFINENPGVTTLGLVKFIVDEAGNKTSYKLMNIRWTDKVKVIYLEPGVYGVTQYVPEYDKIVSYQSFVVGQEPIVIKFRRVF
jgi:hypothetical protein